SERSMEATPQRGKHDLREDDGDELNGGEAREERDHQRQRGDSPPEPASGSKESPESVQNPDEDETGRQVHRGDPRMSESLRRERVQEEREQSARSAVESDRETPHQKPEQ